MNSTSRTSILLALLVILTAAHPAAAAGAEKTYEYVKKVTVWNDNRLMISVAGEFSTDHGCDNRSFAASRNNFDHSQTKAMMKIAMASYLARKPVWIATSGCDSGDSSGRPILGSLRIQEEGPAAPPPRPRPNPRCTANQKCCGVVSSDGTCDGECIPERAHCQ